MQTDKIIPSRVIVVETSSPYQPLLTPIPNLSISHLRDVESRPTDPSEKCQYVDGFSRAAQSATLLDGVLGVLRRRDRSGDWYNVVETLDKGLNWLLATLLQQFNGVSNSYCAAIAIVLR